MAGDEDRLAHALQPLEQVSHLDAGPGIKAAGRLVEQEHLRVVQQHPRQPQPLRHPTGEARHQFVALRGQVDQFQRPFRHPPPLQAIDPVGGGEELQILAHPHVVVDAEDVGHVADRPTDLAGMGVDRVPADIGLAPGRREQGRENANRGRLAGTVGADEAEQVTRLELQVERLQCKEIAILLGEVDRLDHGAGSVARGITMRHRVAAAGRGSTFAATPRRPIVHAVP